MNDCVQLQSKILSVDHPDTLSSSATLIDWQTDKLEIDESEADGAEYRDLVLMNLARDQ